MFQYRISLAQMRRGAYERGIARSHCMGRHKLADLRALAEQHGWLDAQTPFPEDAEIAAAVGAPKLAASTVSTLESHRERIAGWLGQGLQGTTDPGGAEAQSRLPGSYSSAYRMIVALRGECPPGIPVPLSFAPGEAAQVDSGAGPMLRKLGCFRLTMPDGPNKTLGQIKCKFERLQRSGVQQANRRRRRFRARGVLTVILLLQTMRGSSASDAQNCG
ncbi:hypothetical protein [Variovorax rhizosphaerae]|uniref:Uncharacterized protein n=1 Tax=Variovorax rhizosphaerae TaxID=1836200 RepID=A0ABU8WYT6_9BURK